MTTQLATPLRAEPRPESLAAARELAMDSAHIPLIANIIDRHFDAMSEDAKRLDMIEEASKKYRYTGSVIASEAPARDPSWRFYFDGHWANTLREAIDKAALTAGGGK